MVLGRPDKVVQGKSGHSGVPWPPSGIVLCYMRDIWRGKLDITYCFGTVWSGL